jgi:hypothetical protein
VFVGALMGDARGSVNGEPGCARFDVLRDSAGSGRVYLHEVYKDEQALEAHRAAPHYSTASRCDTSAPRCSPLRTPGRRLSPIRQGV